MALFTDGVINTISDLQSHDAGILDMANGEGIDLSEKTALAQQEIGDELIAFLTRHPTQDPRGSAMFDIYTLWGSGRRAYGLGDVVVTPAMKTWHALQSLVRAYRDAYFNQLNDRYQKKAEAFETESLVARQRCYDAGIAIAMSPVPKAAPSITGNGDDSNATIFVRVSWVNASGQEGVVSDAAGLTGTTATVQAGAVPTNVTGWKVYAGASPDDVMLQTPQALALNASWTAPAGALQTGAAPGNGQGVDTYILNINRTPRG